MNYVIGQKYKINPFKSLNETGYDAEYVGSIKIDKVEKYPIFKFDFYKSKNPTCFMALDGGACLCHGESIAAMLDRFHSLVSYYGSQHQTISLGGIKLDKSDFVTQARNCNISDAIIQESLNTGCYNGAKASNGGDIKWCPSCKKIRITDCCACGCGSCSICGHRWCCRPIDFPVMGVAVNPLGFRSPLNLV